MRKRTLQQLHGLLAKALAHGARRVSATRVVWDISGNCTEPYMREHAARPSPVFYPEENRSDKTILVDPSRTNPMVLEMSTRCRKCDNCRRLRQNLWTLRAASETRSAARTWFGTLTLRPDAQNHFLSVARARLDRRKVDFDTLPFRDQFDARHRAIAVDLTKMVKRIRKNSGSPLRYLLVAEMHKSGAPHYHMLVHEVSIEHPVRYTVLDAAWSHGFSKWKLVTNVRQATYLCKYLSKSAAARVRASKRYGELGELEHTN